MKSRAKQAEMTAMRERMFRLYALIPESGCYVQWLGLKLKVGPTVFWPQEDSIPLALNYQINPGEKVLDVCSGSGNLVVLSGLKGAKRVVGLEWNPNSVKVANENIKEYDLADRCMVRQSDMFSALKCGERFDVITGNPPFINKRAENRAQTCMHDTDLYTHRRFFEGVNEHLNPQGRIYLAHFDLGALEEMKELANSAGFSVKKIGQYTAKKPHIVFGAYELIRRQ
jgi:methylase of polypeptide subunit release factors